MKKKVKRIVSSLMFCIMLIGCGKFLEQNFYNNVKNPQIIHLYFLVHTFHEK